MSWLDKFFQSGYTTVQSAGVAMPLQHTINFAAGVSVTDDPTNSRTNVSATPQSISVKSSPYNAKGDGSTDDGPAFQAAINALAGTGSALYVPAGTYRIATKVTLASNLQIIASPGVVFKSALTAHIDPNNAMFWFNAPTSNATTLASTPAPGSKTLQVVGAGPYSAGQFVFVNRVSPNNFQSAIYRVTSVSGASPQTITLDRPIRYTFQSGDPITQITPLQNFIFQGNDCLISGTGDRFIEIAGGWGSWVSDVRADTSLGTPFDLMFSFDQSSYGCQWVRMSIDGGGATSVGLALESVENCDIIDCNVKGTNSSGITLYDCVNCTVVRCLCSNNAAHGVTLTGDGNTIGCSYCVIDGGDFSGNAGSGVSLTNGTSYCNVRGVTCNANTVDGILVGSGGGPSTGNVLSGCMTASNTQDGIGIGATANAANTTVMGCVSQKNGDVDINIGSDCILSGFTSPAMATFGGIFIAASAGTIKMDNIHMIGTHGPGIEVSAGNKVYLSNAYISASGVTAIDMHSGAGSSLWLNNTQVAAASSGLVVAANNTAYIGLGVDLTAATTPISNSGTTNMAQDQGVYTSSTATGTDTMTQLAATANKITSTASLSNNVTVNVPAGIAGLRYVVFFNGTLNAHTWSVGVTGGTAISIGAGKHAILESDGTNMQRVTADT